MISYPSDARLYPKVRFRRVSSSTINTFLMHSLPLFFGCITYLKTEMLQKCPKNNDLHFFRRGSDGFSAFLGIIHIRPNFITPGMRPSSQNFCTRLSEIPHFFAASGQEIYSIRFNPPAFISVALIIYGQANTSRHLL